MTAAPNPEQPKQAPEQKQQDAEQQAKQRSLQMQLYRNRFAQFWHDNCSWPQMLNYLLILAVTLGLGRLFVFSYEELKLGTLIHDLELKTYDMRFFKSISFNNLEFLEQTQKPSEDVVIVEFDDTSMMVLGEDYGTWPWPREVHAQMMDYFENVGAKSVIYDIMFVGYQKNMAESDQKFIEAFKKHKNVYLAMNLDTELKQFAQVKFSKGVSEEDFLNEWDQTVQRVDPLTVPLVSDLREGRDAKVELLPQSDTYMFDNHFLGFNHFMSVMPELLEEKGRIGFINHARDNDSISRGNPLFFYMEHMEPVETKDLPLHFDEAKNTWLDAKGNPVTEDGYLLENSETRRNIKKRQLVYKYFPYLGLKYAMKLKYGNQPQRYTLTPEGQLKVNDTTIPLRRDGVFPIYWYNQNFVQELRKTELDRMMAQRRQLVQIANPSPEQKDQLLQVEVNVQELSSTIEANKNKVKPFPYAMFKAIDVITALNNEARGEVTPKDKALRDFFKDKIIFVGITAVAQYDIKSTPVDPHLPGVLVQAQLFDNIRQGHFMVQADKKTNTMIWMLLCLVAVWIVYKYKSAMAAFCTVTASGIIYVAIAVVLFRYHYYWIDIVFPLIMMTVVTMLSLVGKHVIADKMYKKTYQMATTDPMTGLYNFRFFKELVPKCIAEADHVKGKFSLILIDIDHFKKFNDTHGHQAGDEVLRCVARKLRETVRSNDFVIRYGGEEMGIILDKAPEEVALRVAQKVVEEVAKSPYPIAEGVEKHVTISVGVATYPLHGKTTEELVEFADKGLYRAKESGRNKVGAQYDEDIEMTPPPDSGAGH